MWYNSPMDKKLYRRTVSVSLTNIEYQKLLACVDIAQVSQSEIIKMGLQQMFDTYLNPRESDIKYVIKRTV